MKTNRIEPQMPPPLAQKNGNHAVDCPPAPAESPPKGDSYHHGNLRATLIRIGLQVLESVPHAEISVREVARRAGVSANAMYRHFESKEALLSILAAEGFKLLGRTMSAAANAASARTEALRACSLAYVRFSLEHPALFRLMSSSLIAAQGDESLLKASKAPFDGFLMILAECGQRQVQNPESIDEALFIWSVIHGLSHLALEGQLNHLEPDVRDIVDKMVSRVKILAP